MRTWNLHLLENCYIAGIIHSLITEPNKQRNGSKGLISLLMGFFIFGPLFSQDFVHFTQDNGLPSNKIYMMTIDRNGFIWCATDKGIAMYNGDRFTNYTVRNGLPLNDLWKIYAAPDGKIWFFARSNRLGYIENGKVSSFYNDLGLTLNPTNFAFENDQVGIVMADRSYRYENQMWRSKGLNKELTDKLRKQVYGRKRVSAFLFGNIHQNLILTIGVNELNNSNELKQYNCNSDLIATSIIPGDLLQLKALAPSVLFIEDSLIYCHIQDRLCIYHVKTHFLETIFLNKYFEKNSMQNMYMFYEHGNLIFNGPCGKYLMKGDSLLHVIRPIDVPVNNYKINSWFRDDLGNTWISTLNDGIVLYPYCNTLPGLFNGDNVQHIYWFNGILFAGVENKGLYKIKQRKIEPVKTLSTYFYSIDSSGDSAVSFFSSNQIGTLYNDKLILSELHDTFYYSYYRESYLFNSPNVKCYYKDSGGEYWANSTTLFIRNSKSKLGYHDLGVYQIIRFKNKLVLGTTTGVKYLDSTIIRSVVPDKAVKVNKLLLFKDYLLVGSEGLGLFAYRDSVMNIVGTEDLNVKNVVSVSDTSLWIATDMGAHEVVFNQGNFKLRRSVLRSNGLLSNMVNDVEMVGDSLYCATENGLCVISLSHLNLKNKPSIIFTRINANDSVIYGPDTMIVKSKKRNFISVNFDIAFLSEHAQLRTFYQVSPLSSQWIELNSSGFTITGLKPGKYRIKIKTEGFNGNTNEKSFVLIIKPRWFETQLFVILAIIGGILLGTGLIFIIVSYITQRRNQKFKIENELVNLELHALRSKLNPHFIFNTFNAIQLYINNNQTELSEKYLILLSKHIRNVFEFSHLQKIPLEKEISLLKDYLEIEKTRFGDKIDISISVDEKLNITNQQIPSMIIQPYVENSMVHGLFHKEGTGHLQVDFIYVNETTYQVRISDDGIGFIQQESERVSSTKVNRDRIDLINQSGDFYITVNKTFLDESKKDKGTIITITISDGK